MVGSSAVGGDFVLFEKKLFKTSFSALSFPFLDHLASNPDEKTVHLRAFGSVDSQYVYFVVAANNFFGRGMRADQLALLPLATTPVASFQPRRIEWYDNVFLDGREVGDEQRYVALRKEIGSNFCGSILPPPSMLVHSQKKIQSSVENAEERKGGHFVAKEQGISEGQPATELLLPSFVRDLSRATENRELSFLRDTPHLEVFRYRLKKGQNDVILRMRSSFCQETHLEVAMVTAEGTQIAISCPSSSEMTRTFDVPFRRERKVVDPPTLDDTKCYKVERTGIVLDKETVHNISGLEEGMWQVYDTREKCVSLLKSLGRFSVLPKVSGRSVQCSYDKEMNLKYLFCWSEYSEQEKLNVVESQGFLEVLFFIYLKDRPFFDKYLQEMTALKAEKTFIDHYLLGNDLSQYLELSLLQSLSPPELVLLAVRVPSATDCVRRRLEASHVKSSTTAAAMDSVFLSVLRCAEGQIEEGARERIVERESGQLPRPPPSSFQGDAFPSRFMAPVSLMARAGSPVLSYQDAKTENECDDGAFSVSSGGEEYQRRRVTRPVGYCAAAPMEAMTEENASMFNSWPQMKKAKDNREEEEEEEKEKEGGKRRNRPFINGPTLEKLEREPGQEPFHLPGRPFRRQEITYASPLSKARLSTFDHVSIRFWIDLLDHVERRRQLFGKTEPLTSREKDDVIEGFASILYPLCHELSECLFALSLLDIPASQSYVIIGEEEKNKISGITFEPPEHSSKALLYFSRFKEVERIEDDERLLLSTLISDEKERPVKGPLIAGESYSVRLTVVNISPEDVGEVQVNSYLRICCRSSNFTFSML